MKKNLSKKIFIGLYFSVIIFSLVMPFGFLQAADATGTPPLEYKLLAPIPVPFEGEELTTFQVNEGGALAKYLNVMIKAFIGICAVLAMVMIVMGGLEYMTSELISSKEAGKNRIRDALFGLLLALGAYAILNSINPKLLQVLDTTEDIDVVQLTVVLDDANFERTEQATDAVGTGYQVSGTRSPGVDAFVGNIGSGGSISSIVVRASPGNAIFYAGNNQVTIPIRVGFNGIAAAGQGTPGDGKTPIGVYNIGERRIPGNGQAALTNVINGKRYNMGPAFINIGVTDSSGRNRGIGFHGRYASGLGGVTNGCVRMTNDDLLALAPFMKSGVQVFIQN